MKPKVHLVQCSASHSGPTRCSQEGTQAKHHPSVYKKHTQGSSPYGPHAESQNSLQHLFMCLPHFALKLLGCSESQSTLLWLSHRQ